LTTSIEFSDIDFAAIHDLPHGLGEVGFFVAGSAAIDVIVIRNNDVIIGIAFGAVLHRKINRRSRDGERKQ
jgi:hypothetical protein